MDKYLYIFIVLFIFLCICLLSKGCINLYETFSIGSQNIKISDTLLLNTNNCEIDPIPPDPCVPNPCQNSGTCNNGICTCIDGYTGQHCKIDPIPPDPCVPNPCQNGGTCNNGICTCIDGYTGQHCEIDPIPPDPCVPNPCQNSGTCNNGICTCIDGYTGQHCDIAPTQKCNYVLSNFPEKLSDGNFKIQYKNSSKIPIRIYFNPNQAPHIDNTGTNMWNQMNTDKFSKFYKYINSDDVNPIQILNVDGNIDQPYFRLNVGEILQIRVNNKNYIIPPGLPGEGTIINGPFFYNYNAGVTTWTIPDIDPEKPGNQNYTAIEFNVGPYLPYKGINYDLSGVDGVNSNVLMEYTCDCSDTIKQKDTKKKIFTNINNCDEFEVEDSNSIKTCMSPKNLPEYIPNPTMEYCDTGTEKVCSGCPMRPGGGPKGGVLDPSEELWCKDKLNCHKWWSNNDIAKKWRAFLNNCGPNTFDSYEWAYAEKIYNETYNNIKPPSCDNCQQDDKCCPTSDPPCCHNNNNCDPINAQGLTLDNIVSPNIQCNGNIQNHNIESCELNIEIFNIKN